MQRPQSEGRVSSPPRHQRHTNRHRKTSVLSKSCVLLSKSSSPRHNGGEQQHTSVGGEPRIKDGDYDRPPRRPKTTPKPRIERLLVGPGKAHIQEAHSSTAVAAPGSTLFFMTHLPDSPPRPNRKLTTQSASASSSSESDDDEEDDNKGGAERKTGMKLMSCQPPKNARGGKTQHAAAGPVPNVIPGYEEKIGDQLERQLPLIAAEMSEPEQPGTHSHSSSLETSNSRTEGEGHERENACKAQSAVVDPTAPTVVVMGSEGAEHREADTTEPAKGDGPLRIDLLMNSFEAADAAAAASSPTSYPQLDTSDEEEEDDTNEDANGGTKLSARVSDQLGQMKESDASIKTSIRDGGDDMEDSDEYSRSLITRRRMAQEEQHREQLRGELESYVTLLTSRKGEDGAQFVEFPRNYQQVLSLMSERDVRDGDPASGSSSSGGVNGGQRSWSHVLIQAGLSKQQAFVGSGLLRGALNEENEASGGEGGMAAKIALKMARVRQLDAVLEEKLGKNLYASMAIGNSSKGLVKKTKLGTADPGGKAKPIKDVAPSNNNNQNSVANGDDSMGPLSITTSSGGGGTNSKGGSNFIERNRKVIAHGMKAVLSKDEESRLSRLLRDLRDDNATEAPESATTMASTQGILSASGIIPTEPLGRNEFEMDANDKKQIEELIVAKRGVYQTSLLPSEEYNDLGIDDDDDQKASISEVHSSTSKSKSAFNIIQATKKERFRKQRLERIEQEIQFLKENECMSIVADDADDDNSDINSMFNDDTFSDVASTGDDGRTATAMSVRSLQTTASSVANSICSTRSGVISRRQFNQFLALEKQEFKPETKASADEIRRLVVSLSHLRTTTPTTSRPVA